MGGTLHADVEHAGFAAHRATGRSVSVHGIVAEEGSVAAKVLGGASAVNSFHHQAVADCGRKLRATAWSDDGVVEAVEGEGVLGVQWHPERFASGDPGRLAPFEWLVSR
jgi:putative glutamine amidotransferase